MAARRVSQAAINGGRADAAEAAAPVLASVIAAELAAIVGDAHVERDVWLTDASGLGGSAPVLVRPADAEEVRRTVAWAYQRNVAIVPVGGRTGYSGGIAPEAGLPLVAVALDG